MSKKKRIIIIILIIIFVFFLGLNIIWFIYRYVCFDKVINNHTEFSEISRIENDGYTLNTYNEDKSMNYSVSVYYPKYLCFNGNYYIGQSLYLNEDGNGYKNQFLVTMTSKPSLFSKRSYIFTIKDYNSQNNYCFLTNENIEIIKNFGADPYDVIEKAKKDINETINLDHEYFLEN